MIITINENWRIASDPLQWIIQKRYGKDGNSWRNVAYVTNLASALVTLGERQIFAMEGVYPSEALKPLCHALTTFRGDISRALEGITTEAAAYSGRAAQ